MLVWISHDWMSVILEMSTWHGCSDICCPWSLDTLYLAEAWKPKRTCCQFQFGRYVRSRTWADQATWGQGPGFCCWSWFNLTDGIASKYSLRFIFWLGIFAEKMKNISFNETTYFPLNFSCIRCAWFIPMLFIFSQVPLKPFCIQPLR